MALPPLVPQYPYGVDDFAFPYFSEDIDFGNQANSIATEDVADSTIASGARSEASSDESTLPQTAPLGQDALCTAQSASQNPITNSLISLSQQGLQNRPSYGIYI